MTQKIKKICLAFCLLASQSMMSQDVLYSQFNYNPVNLNPGFAGTGKNNLRLSALSKVQWLNLYKPFKYFSGAVDFSAYDYDERNIFNGALNITNSNKGYLSNTNISGVVGRSFGTNTVDCSNWFLSIALQAGYNFAKVDPNKFVFIDQIDQTGYTGNASEVDLFYTNNTKNYFDFSSGFVSLILQNVKYCISIKSYYLRYDSTSLVSLTSISSCSERVSLERGFSGSFTA